MDTLRRQNSRSRPVRRLPDKLFHLVRRLPQWPLAHKPFVNRIPCPGRGNIAIYATPRRLGPCEFVAVQFSPCHRYLSNFRGSRQLARYAVRLDPELFGLGALHGPSCHLVRAAAGDARARPTLTGRGGRLALGETSRLPLGCESGRIFSN